VVLVVGAGSGVIWTASGLVSVTVEYVVNAGEVVVKLGLGVVAAVVSVVAEVVVVVAAFEVTAVSIRVVVSAAIRSLEALKALSPLPAEDTLIIPGEPGKTPPAMWAGGVPDGPNTEPSVGVGAEETVRVLFKLMLNVKLVSPNSMKLSRTLASNTRRTSFPCNVNGRFTE